MLHNVHTAVRVVWDAPSHGGANISGYIVQYMHRLDIVDGASEGAEPVDRHDDTVTDPAWNEFGDALAAALAEREPDEPPDIGEVVVPIEVDDGDFESDGGLQGRSRPSMWSPGNSETSPFNPWRLSTAASSSASGSVVKPPPPPSSVQRRAAGIEGNPRNGGIKARALKFGPALSSTAASSFMDDVDAMDGDAMSTGPGDRDVGSRFNPALAGTGRDTLILRTKGSGFAGSGKGFVTGPSTGTGTSGWSASPGVAIGRIDSLFVSTAGPDGDLEEAVAGGKSQGSPGGGKGSPLGPPLPRPALPTTKSTTGWSLNSATVPAADRKLTITSAGPSSTVRFRVFAVNSVGVGMPTEWIKFFIPDAPVFAAAAADVDAGLVANMFPASGSPSQSPSRGSYFGRLESKASPHLVHSGMASDASTVTVPPIRGTRSDASGSAVVLMTAPPTSLSVDFGTRRRADLTAKYHSYQLQYQMYKPDEVASDIVTDGDAVLLMSPASQAIARQPAESETPWLWVNVEHDGLPPPVVVKNLLPGTRYRFRYRTGTPVAGSTSWPDWNASCPSLWMRTGGTFFHFLYKFYAGLLAQLF